MVLVFSEADMELSKRRRKSGSAISPQHFSVFQVGSVFQLGTRLGLEHADEGTGLPVDAARCILQFVA